MIGYSGDIQTAGFQQNLLNKIKYDGFFFLMTTLLYSSQRPCQKIKVSVSAKKTDKQRNKKQLQQQMRGKDCRSRKPLLQSYEYKMAYEYEFKQSSHILNNHLSH